MKFTAKRLLGVGVMAIAAVAAPLSITELTGGTTAVATQSSAPLPGCSSPTSDVACYVQSTTSPVDTFQYTQAGSNNAATQTATVSGPCATVPAPPPYLNMCGFVYSSSTYPGWGTLASPKTASLGTSGTATGVGAVSPSWTLDNKTSGNKSNAEAIDFCPGSCSPGGATRLFNDAKIAVQRKDTGVAQNSTVTVQLAEIDPASGKVVATQDCAINGGQGTGIIADTNTGPGGLSTCVPTPANPATGTQQSPPAPSTFQIVEVRDLTNSTSISVVNTSMFTLQNQICGGQSITPTGETAGVTATLSIPPGGGCKTYNSFTYQETGTGGTQQLSFDAFSAGSVPFNIDVTWAPIEPACQPTADTGNVFGSSPGVPNSGAQDPSCGNFEFLLNGQNTAFDEAFCGPPQRVDGAAENVAYTNTSDVVTDNAITTADKGRPVYGNGIPPNTYVGTVTNGSSFLLSSSPTGQSNPGVIPSSGGSSVTLAPVNVVNGVTVPSCVTVKTYTLQADSNGTPETVIHEEISALTDYTHFR